MARELPVSEEIQRLIRSSETAREVLGSEIRDLKHRMDIPARVRSSLKSNPTGWIGGSVLAGLAGSLLFRRKDKREKPKKKGLLGFLLALGVAALRPFVKVWLAGQLKNYLGARFGHGPYEDLPASRSHRATPFYK
jgi:hypothetical protein